MGTKFTREQFEQRIDNLYTYAREQGFSIIALGPGNSGRHHYLVLNGENILEISLTSMGGFLLSTEQGMGGQGRISPQLLAWLEHEGLRYEYDQPFSRLACEYLSGVEHDYAIHTPRVKRQGLQEVSLEERRCPLIRQLIPAQAGWFAVYATVPVPGEQEEGVEMRPIIGWALVNGEVLDMHTPGNNSGYIVVALCVLGAVDLGSLPDARAHLVLHDRNRFLGYAYQGCTIDWKERAVSYRKTADDAQWARDWEG